MKTSIVTPIWKIFIAKLAIENMRYNTSKFENTHLLSL